MHLELLPLLACPVTGSALTLEKPVEDGQGGIAAGSLVSAEGKVYPIHDGVPRFVDTDQYVGSFSLQRRYVRQRFEQWTQEQGREVMFEDTTQLPLADLSGKLVLDAGCGYGRFLDPVSKAGATVVGIDLSTDSINLSQAYVGSRRNVHLVQGDLMNPPFKKGIFDAAYSIGVLHHTPSTKGAFDSVAKLVKPGGKFAVWLYAPEDKRFDDILRLATTKMPPHVVLAVSAFRHVTGQGARLLLGRKEATVFKDFWPKVMGQFDSLAPTYAFVHTFAEVEGWFAAMGWTNVRRSSRRTAVTGTRPA